MLYDIYTCGEFQGPIYRQSECKEDARLFIRAFNRPNGLTLRATGGLIYDPILRATVHSCIKLIPRPDLERNPDPEAEHLYFGSTNPDGSHWIQLTPQRYADEAAEFSDGDAHCAWGNCLGHKVRDFKMRITKEYSLLNFELVPSTSNPGGYGNGNSHSYGGNNSYDDYGSHDNDDYYDSSYDSEDTFQSNWSSEDDRMSWEQGPSNESSNRNGGGHGSNHYGNAGPSNRSNFQNQGQGTSDFITTNDVLMMFCNAGCYMEPDCSAIISIMRLIRSTPGVSRSYVERVVEQTVNRMREEEAEYRARHR